MRAPQSWYTEVLRAGDPTWSATTEEIDAGFVRVGFEIEDIESFPEITGPLAIGRVEHIEELHAGTGLLTQGGERLLDRREPAP